MRALRVWRILTTIPIARMLSSAAFIPSIAPITALAPSFSFVHPYTFSYLTVDLVMDASAGHNRMNENEKYESMKRQNTVIRRARGMPLLGHRSRAGLKTSMQQCHFPFYFYHHHTTDTIVCYPPVCMVNDYSLVKIYSQILSAPASAKRK